MNRKITRLIFGVTCGGGAALSCADNSSASAGIANPAAALCSICRLNNGILYSGRAEGRFEVRTAVIGLDGVCSPRRLRAEI